MTRSVFTRAPDIPANTSPILDTPRFFVVSLESLSTNLYTKYGTIPTRIRGIKQMITLPMPPLNSPKL